MNHSTEDPTDALSILGNETRIEILRKLAEADGALSFTELREQVDIRDTGKFNYHLTKLCSYFVRECETGYELGHAGTRIIDATHQHGTPTPDGSEATDESATCPVCGSDDCEKLFHIHLTPPDGMF